jgi:hypothetical protein
MELAALVLAVRSPSSHGGQIVAFVDAVIETKRGHDLGRVILEGQAEPDTGMPGEIVGATSQRVLHAPEPGRFVASCAIGGGVLEALLMLGGVSGG